MKICYIVANMQSPIFKGTGFSRNCRLDGQVQEGSSEEEWVNKRTHAKSLQWYPTLCDPVDCSTPGSSVHGILQTRILEWVAISSSRRSFLPIQGLNSCLLCLLHWQEVSLLLAPPGKPKQESREEQPRQRNSSAGKQG